MDILEWIFKQRPEEKQLPEVSSLKASIRTESNLFHNLWKLHEKKAAAVKAYADKGEKSALRKIIGINKEILESLLDILKLDNIENAIMKKILYEATEKLHQAKHLFGDMGKYGILNKRI